MQWFQYCSQKKKKKKKKREGGCLFLFIEILDFFHSNAYLAVSVCNDDRN